MSDRLQLLDETVIRHLRPAVSNILTSIEYAALEGEVEQASDLAVPIVCIGGEVILHFAAVQQPVVVTWAENAGWPDHFSLQIRSDSAFRLATLVNWPANDLPPWLAHIGSPLIDARLFGQHGTPHLLELGFRNGRVLLGDGHEVTFGDGDDLIVRPANDPALLDGWDLIWSSS